MSEVIDREDAYLATMAQEYSDVLPEPVTRKDRYLVKIIDILAQTSGITREEVSQMINDAISKIDQLTRKTVASVNDIDVTAADADQYLYMVPVQTPEAGNNYDEYIVVNQSIEHIGDTTMDLSDYVKDTDYATNSKGGVIKTSTSYGTDISYGLLIGVTKSRTTYKNSTAYAFISKGTLENLAETWTFTDEDGVVTTKKVYVSPVE